MASFLQAQAQLAHLGFQLKRGGDEESDEFYFQSGAVTIFADTPDEAIEKAKDLWKRRTRKD